MNSSSVLRVQRRRRSNLICRLLLLAACSLAATITKGRQERQHRGSEHEIWPQAEPDVVQRGHSQFQKTCAFCHGADANGGSQGPNLMRSAVVRHDENGNLIGPVVLEGRLDKGMPAFQLTPDQITDVAAFLRYRLEESDRRSPKHPGADYSAAKLLVGSVDSGRTYFNGPGGCSACHSATSDLRGIASRYPAAELQAQFLYPQDQHLTATVTDSSGRQYTGEVRLLTNYDVAIEDRAGWYHSWPLDTIKLALKDPVATHRELLSQFTDSEMHDILAYLETLK